MCSGHGPFSHMFEEVVAELRPEINWKVSAFLLV
jgi:HD superfamily phosphohydrolase